MPVRTLDLDVNSPLYKKLLARVASRVRLGEKGQSDQVAKWQQAEELTLAFLPESEADALRRAKRQGGEPRYTTIQIPYSYALLMSAHTYWTSVFFARNPVHQFTGRHGEGEQQIQAMEALISYQVDIGMMMVPYFVWLYDTGKYGAGIVGEYWCKEKLHYGQLVEMDDGKGGVQLMQTTQEVEGYQGNRTYNVAPYDFLHDPRVQFKNFQQGEFCCARVRPGWNEILRRQEQGWYNKNIDKLKNHVTDKGQNGSSALVRPNAITGMEMREDETESTKHPAGATFWEVYVELVPEEWGLGKGLMFPQKWVFTITEDLGLLVGASPLGYAHCRFPFSVMEMEVEGYGLYARGLPEMSLPLQNTIDWLINTHFFNVRASLNNQFIVDPSKLVIKDVQRGGPGFIWRLRPEAYGTDLKSMFMQVPVQDVTRNHLSDFQMMMGIGERTFGINEQIMGALNTGGRKTATEIRTSAGFGVNRLKTNSEYMSAMGFSAHAQKLVQASQQYYDAEAKLRRVGSFAEEAGANFINVTPEAIAGFYDLVPVDGTLPIDRMALANLWKELMGNWQRMPPQVQVGYDWGRIFAWAANIGGLKNIQQFRVQVVPDASIQQQAAAGNVIPMRQGGPPGLPKPGAVQPGNSASTAAGLNALEGKSGPGY